MLFISFKSHSDNMNINCSSDVFRQMYYSYTVHIQKRGRHTLISKYFSVLNNYYCSFKLVRFRLLIFIEWMPTAWSLPSRVFLVQQLVVRRRHSRLATAMFHSISPQNSYPLFTLHLIPNSSYFEKSQKIIFNFFRGHVAKEIHNSYTKIKNTLWKFY